MAQHAAYKGLGPGVGLGLPAGAAHRPEPENRPARPGICQALRVLLGCVSVGARKVSAGLKVLGCKASDRFKSSRKQACSLSVPIPGSQLESTFLMPSFFQVREPL